LGHKPSVAKAKRGGNSSYMASLQKEKMSMSERGKLGGRPEELTLTELDVLDRGAERPSL